MSCSTLSQLTVRMNVSIGSLPEGFCPENMQDLGEAIASRLVITPNQNFTSFAIGSIPPTSNVGPWLKDCLTWYVFNDESATYIPMEFPSIAALKTGMIIPWAGTFTSVPSGFLSCDGTEYANTAYPALFALIGTTYGSTTAFSFKVPDFRNLFLVGAGQDSANIAKTNVSDGATLLKNRAYTTHTHPMGQDSPQDGNGTRTNFAIGQPGVDTPRAIPPFLAVVMMIKT